MNTAPSVVAFDVNETLSDMSSMAGRFSDVGAPAHLAKLWFAQVLRDGFTLAATGYNESFADVGAEVLREVLHGLALDRDLEDAVGHVMAGMTDLDVHPDVPRGIQTLNAAGLRLVTLSNGAPLVAEKLFARAQIREEFELLLSVEDAPAWKPARSAYEYAARACGVGVEELMLVAVHPWDVHGAACAGLQTAWINRTGARWSEYFTTPDLTVASVEELAGELVVQPGTDFDQA